MSTPGKVNPDGSWEPGSLPTFRLETILTDALADLWRDYYRISDVGDGERLRQFRRTVENAMYCATGREINIERKGVTS